MLTNALEKMDVNKHAITTWVPSLVAAMPDTLRMDTDVTVGYLA